MSAPQQPTPTTVTLRGVEIVPYRANEEPLSLTACLPWLSPAEEEGRGRAKGVSIRWSLEDEPPHGLARQPSGPSGRSGKVSPGGAFVVGGGRGFLG